MFSLNFIQTIKREIDGRVIIFLIFESKHRKIGFDSNIEKQTSLTKPKHNISNALSSHIYKLNQTFNNKKN